MIDFLLYTAAVLLVLSTALNYYQTSWVYRIREWWAHRTTKNDKPEVGDIWSNNDYGYIKIIDVDDKEVEFKLIDGTTWKYSLSDWYNWIDRTGGYRYTREK